MSGHISVYRLRVSYVAGRIHNAIREIGDPEGFEARLRNPAPVGGLPVGLPYNTSTGVDWGFWAMTTESQLPTRINTYQFLKAAVPLRYRGQVRCAANTSARLEAHLHPFGVIVLLTVDLDWPASMDLSDVWEDLDALENESVTVQLNGSTQMTTIGDSANDVAGALVRHLTTANTGISWPTRSHRLVTVVSAKPGSAYGSVQPWWQTGGPLHADLNQLACGDILAAPSSSFVAQWSGSGFVWPETSLIYMLAGGTAIFSSQAFASARHGPRRSRWTTSDRHRLALLTIAHITALQGLVSASLAGANPDGYFEDWAGHAAKRLGRLYGPMQGYESWALVPTALMQRLGTNTVVSAIPGGSPLTRTDHWPDAPFPGP